MNGRQGPARRLSAIVEELKAPTFDRAVVDVRRPKPAQFACPSPFQMRNSINSSVVLVPPYLLFVLLSR